MKFLEIRLDRFSFEMAKNYFSVKRNHLFLRLSDD